MSDTNGHKHGYARKKGGRPRKKLEPAQAYKLARIGCTNVEIATILGCSDDTLTKRFSEILRKGRETMRMSLRRMQYKAATEGNHTILIWLGKQYLQQRDKQEISGPDGGPIQQEHSFTDDREAAQYILKSYIDQGLSEIEARTKAVEAGVDPAALPEHV